MTSAGSTPLPRDLDILRPLLVDGEAAGQDVLIRCAAICAHAGEQAGLEPTAVLVGAFQVHIGRERQALVCAVLEHAGMRDAGFPPHVEDVLLRDKLGAAALFAVRAAADTRWASW